MSRIGLVPMSAKPLHAGHWGLIEIASRENDEVHLYVSLSDRDSISGAGMGRVWKELAEPALPSNVTVTYGGSPIGNVYKELGDADKGSSDDSFTIYSDPTDIDANYKTLDKYAGRLLAQGLIKLRSVSRSTTVNVSGTQMRQWFDADDMRSFIKHLPSTLDGQRVWNILKSTPAAAKAKKKAPVKKPASKKAKKPSVKGEGLLRRYIRLLFGR